jgi:hypothetical protein
MTDMENDISPALFHGRMDAETLLKMTGIACLGYGIYAIFAGLAVILLETVEFAVLFGLIFLAFGILYTAAGISLLRKGKFGPIVFIGMFFSTYWWGTGTPWYVWPMTIMPIVLLIMFILALIKGQLTESS